VPIVARLRERRGRLYLRLEPGPAQARPEISPNKTVEGAVGGLAFAFVFVFG
jgi:hypothetical protein